MIFANEACPDRKAAQLNYFFWLHVSRLYLTTEKSSDHSYLIKTPFPIFRSLKTNPSRRVEGAQLHQLQVSWVSNLLRVDYAFPTEFDYFS